MAKTLDDLKAQNDSLLDAARKNHDLVDAIKTVLVGQRSQIDDLTAQIKALRDQGGASPAELDALYNQGSALLTTLNEDNTAEAILAGTEADPNPAPPTPPEQA